MNAYTKGKSGGDIAFIEIFKRIKDYNLVVVTSRLGEKLCLQMGLKASFRITTREHTFKRIVPTYIRRIINALLLEIQPKDGDVLYATSDALPDTLSVFFLKLRNKRAKWIQKIFHIIPKDRTISSASQRLSFFLIRSRADHISIDNELLKGELVRLGFNENQITVNHLGINPKYYKDIPPSKKKYDATFMARLHPSKGIYDAVNIWNTVVKKLPHAKLAIIGGGDKTVTDALKDRIQRNNLENNIDLLGFLDDAEAFALIKASCVFIFPSHEEGFGIVVLEAIACGVPVVAYKLPAYRHTFGQAIKTVQPHNNNRFATTVVDLLSHAKKLENLRQLGFTVLDEFDWDKTASREHGLL